MKRLFPILLVVATVGWSAFAQPVPSPPGTTGRPVAPPLPPPSVRTPVDSFREMLAMSPTEREKTLSSRSAQSRAFLEGKLKEFEALAPVAREACLQTLQLRWRLLPLMKTAPAQRGDRLAALPEGDRKLVEERLQQWDQLPEDLRRQVLENDSFLRVFFRSQTNAPAVDITSTNLSPAQLKQLEKDQARWEAMSEGERQKVVGLFKQLFDLPPKESSRILEGMGDRERLQMKRALENFSKLPKSRREACLRGFQKFNDLTPEERLQFLSNAERWQNMSAKDRQLWRELVARLQPGPPLPPGLGPKMPPLPPKLPLRSSGTRALTTN